jgi:Polysaccharide lyase
LIVVRVILPFLITSFSANAGIIGNGLADLPILLLPGMDEANSRVSKSDATQPLGWEIVSGSRRWTLSTSRLSGDTLSSADATSGGESHASAPIGVTVVPNTTSFSGANGSRIMVGGIAASVQNANQPWSLTEPDANTLQFSVHSGDHWSTSGWSDLTNDAGAERSEIEFSPTYAVGTQINVSEQLTVQPGPTNTASFLVLNQLHATTQSPPSPFTLQLNKSDHLEVVLQSPNNSYNLVYRSPNPIVRGRTMDLNFQLNMDPSGNGYVDVWLDGVQIVNYHGAVGAAGAEYYWKEGIYRGAAAETITADFSNVQITTAPMLFP